VDLLRRLIGSFWARALISAGLLAAVATQVDFRAATEQLSHGSWESFVLAVAVVFATFLVASKRWLVYLNAVGVHVPYGNVLRAYLIGAFTTNFLPSQVGGDVARAWIVSGHGTRTRAATTVVADRVVALGCLLIVAWIGLLANPGPVPGALISALGAATIGFAVAVLVVVCVLRGSTRIRSLLPERAGGLAREARRAALACISGSVLRRTVAYGLVFQSLVVLSAWLIARSISLGVTFSTLVVILPLVLVLAVLPISIGGLGVREGGFVVLLGQAGIGATEAAVFSLLVGLAFALASLPGAFALFHRRGQGAGRPVGTVPHGTETQAP
jgi:uncharacterized membrane protein YbhN (UPF0104 family)